MLQPSRRWHKRPNKPFKTGIHLGLHPWAESAAKVLLQQGTNHVSVGGKRIVSWLVKLWLHEFGSSKQFRGLNYGNFCLWCSCLFVVTDVQWQDSCYTKKFRGPHLMVQQTGIFRIYDVCREDDTQIYTVLRIWMEYFSNWEIGHSFCIGYVKYLILNFTLE